MSTTPIAPSPGDSAFIASLNDQYTRMFSAYNQPKIDEFNLAVANWQLNDPILASEQITNPSIVRPPRPQPPMLKRIDLVKLDEVFAAYNAALVNGTPATLDLTAAVTDYLMPYTPPGGPAGTVPLTHLTDPIGPEEGIGSGVFSDKDGDDRVNGAGVYRFGVPYRLHVQPTPWAISRYFVVDFTLGQPPTPTFTGDAPAA
jgi:hypothetical protein